MKVFVTGGAGFVGSGLVSKLIEFGHDVMVFDNLSTGHRNNVPEAAEFYHGSILSPLDLHDAMKGFKPDVVYHLATSAGVRADIFSSMTHIDIGVKGSVCVIDASVEHGVSKFIYASSGGTVYGEPEHLPVFEHTATNPISAYGVSKLAVEKYLYHVRHVHGLKSTILRFSNMYAANMPSGVFAAITFMDKLQDWIPPEIFGDGSSVRDYLHLSDAIIALSLAMNDVDGGIYNVGTGVGTTVKKLLDLCQATTGRYIGAIYTPHRPEEIKRNVLDCGKIREVLGWSYTISLEDGLKDCYERRYGGLLGA